MSDPTDLPSFPPSPDEHPLRGRVLDALIDEGISPTLDEDGDVVVDVAIDEATQRVFVRCSDGELPLMRVFGQWRVGEGVPADPLRRLSVAADLSIRLNLVKVGVQDDVLTVAADVLVTDDLPLGPVLRNCVGAVLNAVRLWHGESGGADGDPDHTAGIDGAP